MQLLPAVLQNLGVSYAWLTILFGVGVLQVLTTAPAGIADQFPKDMKKLGGRISGALVAARLVPAAGESDVIEIENLTVRYGGVTSLDGLDLVFEKGTCGLIGPNGAGKTTFFNVLSGFVRPASGTVRAFGDGPAGDGALPARALGGAPHVPDRAGHRGADGLRQRRDGASSLRGAARRADVLGAIEYVGGDASP